MTSVERLGTAVVTGASSGIGAVYADRLARRGYDLILVARNRERLDALARHIGEDTGRAVDVVTADLTRAADLRWVESRLREDASITLLVNNAGVGGAAPLLQSDVDAMEQMIALNVTALTRLAYAAAPGFVARGSGTIVNVSSIVAVAPELLNGVYGGSKAYAGRYAAGELVGRAAGQGDVGRGFGGCGAGRAGSGGVCDVPRAAGRGRLGRVRGGAAGAWPQLVARDTRGTVSDGEQFVEIGVGTLY
jgi:uncharacterized protein